MTLGTIPTVDIEVFSGPAVHEELMTVTVPRDAIARDEDFRSLAVHELARLCRKLYPHMHGSRADSAGREMALRAPIIVRRRHDGDLLELSVLARFLHDMSEPDAT